jgi:hypothetical protein
MGEKTKKCGRKLPAVLSVTIPLMRHYLSACYDTALPELSVVTHPELSIVTSGIVYRDTAHPELSIVTHPQLSIVTHPELSIVTLHIRNYLS